MRSRRFGKFKRRHTTMWTPTEEILFDVDVTSQLAFDTEPATMSARNVLYNTGGGESASFVPNFMPPLLERAFQYVPIRVVGEVNLYLGQLGEGDNIFPAQNHVTLGLAVVPLEEGQASADVDLRPFNLQNTHLGTRQGRIIWKRDWYWSGQCFKQYLDNLGFGSGEIAEFAVMNGVIPGFACTDWSMRFDINPRVTVKPREALMWLCQYSTPSSGSDLQPVTLYGFSRTLIKKRM